MQMRTLALLALLPSVAFAGCLAGNEDDAGDDPVLPDADGRLPLAPFVNPIDLEHDHGELSLHTESNNIDLVSHTYMDGVTPGGLGEIDVAGDYAYVAAFDRGFVIMDISNVSAPKQVSIFEVPTPMGPLGRYTADLKVDQSGDWVFLAMELSEYPGALIVDARDRANPVLAGFWPVPGTLAGCHMVEYAVINEQEYLFCAPLDNAVYVGQILPAAPGASVREIVTIARWVPNSAGYVQHEVDGLTTDPVGTAGRYVLSGHQDMTYQPDPITGAPTLIVSFWNLGLRIVDVSIPALPLEIGYWEGEGAEGYRGAFHTAMMLNVNNTRVAVAIPEGPDPPAIFVLDATDIANPVLLSEWSALPSFTDADGASQAGAFSLHNFQVVDGKIYIAMGHGGLWVVDIGTPDKLRAPEAVGSYYPHQPRKDNQTYAIYPWDVVVYKGYMLNAEGNTGFYVLHFRDDPAGDETYNSFA